MSDLARLAKPFPPNLVERAPSGHGDYVAHHVVNQKLLAVLGPFSFEVTQPIRGASGNIEGCLARLTVTIDGKEVSISEPGDCDFPEQKKTDGDRLKNAASDAFKRCAMRLGCGLHLWSQDDYFLHGQLVRDEERSGVADATEDPAVTPARAVPTAVERSVDTPPLPLGAK